MRLAGWLAQRRASWRPVEGTKAGLVFLFALLASLVGFGLSMVQVDRSGLLQQPTAASWDVLLTTAACLLCLGQIARRSRFQLTARVLSYAAFPVLALFLYLRWTR